MHIDCDLKGAQAWNNILIKKDIRTTNIHNLGNSNSGKFKNKYDPSNGFVFMPNHSLILSHSRDLPEELTVKIGSTPTKILHSREGESWLFILTPRYRYNRLALPGAVAPSLPSSPTRNRGSRTAAPRADNRTSSCRSAPRRTSTQPAGNSATKSSSDIWKPCSRKCRGKKEGKMEY